MNNKEIVLKNQEVVSIKAGEDAKFNLEMVDGKLNVTFEGDLVFNIDGKLEFNIKDGFNLVSKKDSAIDTIEGGKLYFNSKMASQIKDLPESIEYRKKQEELAQKLREASEFLTGEKIHTMSTKERIEYIESLSPEILPSDHEHDCNCNKEK